MRKRGLTIQQELACCFIQTYTKAHGFPPTVREIGAMVGFTGIRSIELAVAALEQQGYLTRTPHARRSILLTARGVVVARRWQLAVLEVA